jgi:DNA-binding NarL/FixJ family response regulator
MRKFRIFLAEDHPIVRFGLRSLFSAHEGWEICGESGDGCETVRKCKQLKPDLLILDICMPKLNGVDAARQILRADPTQKILIFTSVDSELVVRDCLEAGVRGWAFKSEKTEDLIAAVESLARNKSSFSPGVSDLILNGYLRRRSDRAAPPGLTARERQVVQLVCEGKVSKELSALLGVTVKTAETHRSNILRKLKIHTIAELVLFAVRNEIIHVERLPSVRPRSLSLETLRITNQDNFLVPMTTDDGPTAAEADQNLSAAE